ncbi:hypothetical protein LTR66_011719, partial [Elasticomyces elasticus]
MGLFSRKNSKVVAMDGERKTDGNGATRSRYSNGAAGSNLPDIPLPRAPDPALDPAGYLRSIY